MFVNEKSVENTTLEKLAESINPNMTEKEKDEQLAAAIWGNLLENDTITIEDCRRTVEQGNIIASIKVD